MARMNVPQPAYASFTRHQEALAYLDHLERDDAAGVVVKADGLAAGKGAIVCDDLDQARGAVRQMLQERRFGSAGAEVVIEERLRGEEASLLVITDGTRVAPFLPAQDYKPAFDGDRGPNTGGMGAYAPAPVISAQDHAEAMRLIIEPVLRRLREAGAPFQGCLYAGLMKTAAGLKVIEFNCRFGDPEAEAVLPLLESDLLPVLRDVARGELPADPLRWWPECAVCVAMASGGYPGEIETGKPIHGLETAEAHGAMVFHAGTTRRDGQTVSAGGRVLAVTAVRPEFAAARRAAYEAVAAIRFEGAQFRTDVGARVA
jgi:phosphoribosylamine--glycine ligase